MPVRTLLCRLEHLLGVQTSGQALNSGKGFPTVALLDSDVDVIGLSSFRRFKLFSRLSYVRVIKVGIRRGEWI